MPLLLTISCKNEPNHQPDITQVQSDPVPPNDNKEREEKLKELSGLIIDAMLKGQQAPSQGKFENPVLIGEGKTTVSTLEDPTWLEALEPHYPYEILIAPLKEWIQKLKENNAPEKGFILWLEDEYIPSGLSQDKLSSNTDTRARYRNAEELKDKRAVYLTEQERKNVEVFIHNGIFHKNGKNFDTGNLYGKRQWGVGDRGSAIFVLGAGNKFYIGSHGTGVSRDGLYDYYKNRNSTFYHSGFLNGGRALAAGSIAIDKGELLWISNNSGHYKPNASEFLYLLGWLQDNHVNIKGVGANIDPSIDAYFDAHEILLNKGVNNTMKPIYNTKGRPKISKAP